MRYVSAQEGGNVRFHWLGDGLVVGLGEVC
jgi:hypothetical protein